MPIYERVEDGTVTERVAPIPGDYEDTRLGLAVIEGADGWRLAGEQPAAAEPAPTHQAQHKAAAGGADQPPPTNSDKGK